MASVTGDPLDPGKIIEMGVIDRIPLSPVDFDPRGEWKHDYLIVTCHGYLESGNDIQGYLRLERKKANADGIFGLSVRQTIIMHEMTHLQVAEIECREDDLASPLSWTLSSSYKDKSGKPLAGIGEKAKGKAKDYPSARLAADWCLFEALQRHPFESIDGRFDLLEGLSLLKKDHRLTYRGKYPTPDGKTPPLRWFAQIGRGILPYDYWLDERHATLVVAAGSRAYILDEDAEDRVKEELNPKKRSTRTKEAAK